MALSYRAPAMGTFRGNRDSGDRTAYTLSLPAVEEGVDFSSVLQGGGTPVPEWRICVCLGESLRVEDFDQLGRHH